MSALMVSMCRHKPSPDRSHLDSSFPIWMPWISLFLSWWFLPELPVRHWRAVLRAGILMPRLWGKLCLSPLGWLRWRRLRVFFFACAEDTHSIRQVRSIFYMKNYWFCQMWISVLMSNDLTFLLVSCWRRMAHQLPFPFPSLNPGVSSSQWAIELSPWRCFKIYISETIYFLFFSFPVVSLSRFNIEQY